MSDEPSSGALVDDPEIPDINEIEERNEAASVVVDAPGDHVGNVGPNYGSIIINQVRKLREAMEFPPENVRRTLETFVERAYVTGSQTLDSRAAAERLRTRRHLVLLGEPGCGRRTAAIGVLGRLGLPLTPVPTWEPGRPDQFLLAELPAKPDRGYLFVHPDDELASPELGHELRAYRDLLAARGSYLVVVARAAAWAAAGEVWPEAVVTLGPPDRREVLARELRARLPHRDLAWLLAAREIDQLVTHAAVRDVVRLADLLAQAAERPEGAGEPDRVRVWLLREVLGAYQEWTSELRAWFKRYDQAPERLFLLAAAVLEASPAARVLRHAEDLGTRLGATGPPAITTAGIRELTEHVGARLDGPAQRLYFKRPEYAAAVLDYYLSDRSDSFRAVLRSWLADAPLAVRNQSEAAQVADLVAAAVLGIVRRHRDLGFVYAVVTAWAPRRGLRTPLVSLLTALALSPEAGARMRARLNLWATESGNLAVWEVVAEVCTGDLATVYPQVALTRIKNLAIRATGARVPVVVGAVLQLWRRQEDLRPDVLRRLVEWLADPGQPAYAVAAEVVAELGEEFPLVVREGGAEPLDGLAPAVGNLLEHPDRPEQLREALYRWLDLAADDARFAEWLLGVVTGAVSGSFPRVTRVRTLVRGWEGGPPGTARARLRELLIEQISHADPQSLGWTPTGGTTR